MKLTRPFLHLLSAATIVCTAFLSTAHASYVASILDERQACTPGTYSCSGDIVDIVSLPQSLNGAAAVIKVF